MVGFWILLLNVKELILCSSRWTHKKNLNHTLHKEPRGPCKNLLPLFGPTEVWSPAIDWHGLTLWDSTKIRDTCLQSKHTVVHRAKTKEHQLKSIWSHCESPTMLSLAAAFSTLPKRGQDLDLSKASSCTHRSQETVETEVESEASDRMRLWET